MDKELNLLKKQIGAHSRATCAGCKNDKLFWVCSYDEDKKKPTWSLVDSKGIPHGCSEYMDLIRRKKQAEKELMKSRPDKIPGIVEKIKEASNILNQSDKKEKVMKNGKRPIMSRLDFLKSKKNGYNIDNSIPKGEAFVSIGPRHINFSSLACEELKLQINYYIRFFYFRDGLAHKFGFCLYSEEQIPKNPPKASVFKDIYVLSAKNTTGASTCITGFLRKNKILFDQTLRFFYKKGSYNGEEIYIADISKAMPVPKQKEMQLEPAPVTPTVVESKKALPFIVVNDSEKGHPLHQMYHKGLLPDKYLPMYETLVNNGSTEFIEKIFDLGMLCNKIQVLTALGIGDIL